MNYCSRDYLPEMGFISHQRSPKFKNWAMKIKIEIFIVPFLISLIFNKPIN